MAAEFKGNVTENNFRALVARHCPKLKSIVIDKKSHRLTVYLTGVEKEFDMAEKTTYNQSDQDVIG